MRLLVAIAALLLAGCLSTHQKGGAARHSMPPPPAAIAELQQPENPQGPSTQRVENVRTTIHPDGTVVVEGAKAETTIGGSQDLSKIVKAAATATNARKAAKGILLLLLAFVLLKKGWPTPALFAVFGSVTAFITFWWLGPLVFAVGLGVIYGHEVRKIVP